MSMRKRFLKAAQKLLGKRPKGFVVENHKDGVLLNYTLNNDAHRKWGEACEEKMGTSFPIWVTTY